MSTLKKNEFVRWSSKDEDGRFSYKGQVTNLSDDRVEITTTGGVIEVDLDDGKFTKISKPKNWKVPTSTKRPDKKKTTTRTKRDGTSKKDIAIKLYANMTLDLGEEPSRKYAIAKFVDALSMTKAGASTYVAMAKKANR